MRRVTVAELGAVMAELTDDQLRVCDEFVNLLPQLNEQAREVIALTVAANASDTVRRAMETQLFLQELLAKIEKVAAARREREKLASTPPN